MRSRHSLNSMVVAAIFLAFAVVFLVFNFFRSINSPLIFQLDTTVSGYNDFSKRRRFYSQSSAELYYLDKHGYRIALESQGVDVYSQQRTSVPHGVTETPAPTVIEYDVLHSDNEAEKDETIDNNYETLDTTQGALLKKRLQCSYGNPTKNIVLLKTHRTGSSTLANIIYRYGDLNNLEFALPKESSFEYYWPVHFNPSFEDKRYSNSSRPVQMLVNARLHRSSMQLWKGKGASLITVLRDPVSHFESTFYSNYLYALFGLQNVSNPLQQFLKSPKQYLSQYLQKEKKIDIMLNLAVNGQMFDLGLKRIHFSDKDIINRTIEDLHDTIELVLISEYMDESLVLLKRALCWDILDVLYFSLRQRHLDYKDLNITSEMAKQIYQWNLADVALYKHFNKTLWEKISEQDSSFHDEVRELKRQRKSLEKECIASSYTDAESGEMRFRIQPYLQSFNKYLCDKMNMSEIEYIAYLKTKARLKYQEENLYVTKQFQELENRAFNSSTS